MIWMLITKRTFQIMAQLTWTNTLLTNHVGTELIPRVQWVTHSMIEFLKIMYLGVHDRYIKLVVLFLERDRMKCDKSVPKIILRNVPIQV